MASPYQPLQNQSVVSLPDDLKTIAERLIRKKFNMAEEGEVVEKKPKNTKKVRQTTSHIVVEIVPDRRRVPSHYIDHILRRSDFPSQMLLNVPADDMYLADRMVSDRLRFLERRFGIPFEARRVGPMDIPF